jgi:hypothetical protein
MNKLIPHSKNEAANLEIKSSWLIKKDSIEFTITVDDYENSHINQDFSLSGWNNEGLWDYDVVEVFISRTNRLPYLEVQSSPLNQSFALIINNPRISFETPTNLKTKIEITSKNPWVTVFNIPFSDIPGSGNILYGNCFSCLGSAKKRQYYALNINADDIADYHKPELFVKLGEIIER